MSTGTIRPSILSCVTSVIMHSEQLEEWKAELTIPLESEIFWPSRTINFGGLDWIKYRILRKFP
jgi:hypothetical protein